MIKLLSYLGLINLAFQFPHLTALTFVGVFIYQQSSPDEFKQATQLMSTVYSNPKLFAKYLSDKAKELNLSLSQLRQTIVKDIEVPLH